MESNDLLRRYLLGDLSEGEQQEIERECTINDALNEALQTAENDLIDAYVCQELSGEQRQQFENYFLYSPERHTQVEIARMLMNPAIRERVPAGPLDEPKLAESKWKSFLSVRIRFALAAAAVAAIVVLVAVQNQRLKNELSKSRTTQLALQTRMDNLQKPQSQQSQPVSVVTLMLSPGLLRTGGSHQNHVLKLPPSVSAVLFMLTLEPATVASRKYAHYDVVLQTVEGKNLRTIPDLTIQELPDGLKVIPTTFASQLLEEGDYFLILLGRPQGGQKTELASYTFSVTR